MAVRVFVTTVEVRVDFPNTIWQAATVATRTNSHGSLGRFMRSTRNSGWRTSKQAAPPPQCRVHRHPLCRRRIRREVGFIFRRTTARRGTVGLALCTRQHNTFAEALQGRQELSQRARRTARLEVQPDLPERAEPPVQFEPPVDERVRKRGGHAQAPADAQRAQGHRVQDVGEARPEHEEAAVGEHAREIEGSDALVREQGGGPIGAREHVCRVVRI